MYFHNTLRKYTLALLDTFNELEITVALSDTSTITKKIPVKYSSREKSRLFDEHTTEQLRSGNYNILPRSSLSLVSVIKSDQRVTNKHLKINKKELTDTMEFMYNAVPYEFTYQLDIQCRGMNEASMIIEQITTKFNPNYTIRINEVLNQAEATSIPISLLDVSIESEEYEEFSSNIVTIGCGISLKGNFYPPVQSFGKVKNIDMYLNMWHHSELNDYSRATLYNYDVINSVSQAPSVSNLATLDGQFGKFSPVITSILSPTSVTSGSSINLSVTYSDIDNKINDTTIFAWSTDTDSTITTGSVDSVLTGVTPGITTVSVMITDYNGNNSGVFTKQITVI